MIRRPRRRWAPLLWGVVILAMAALLLTLVLIPLGRADTSVQRGRLVDQPAPAIDLLDLEGRRRTLDDGRGRLVWVNFWATWCPPCRTEMPMMQRLAQAYADAIIAYFTE